MRNRSCIFFCTGWTTCYYCDLFWVTNFKKTNLFECIKNRVKWKMFCKLLCVCVCDDNIQMAIKWTTFQNGMLPLPSSSPLKVWIVPQTTQVMPAWQPELSSANQQSKTFSRAFGAGNSQKKVKNNSSTVTINVGLYLFIFDRTFKNTFPLTERFGECWLKSIQVIERGKKVV